MPRLFVALALPEAVRERLVALQPSVSMRGARWVPPAHLHLTLRFLGETPDVQVPPLLARLGRVVASPFALDLKGVGVFPHPARPQVLWAGLLPSEPLAALAMQVEAAVEAAGYAPERKPFHPHITLARLNHPERARVVAFLAQHQDFEAGPFTVSDFRLYASTLHPTGAVYAPLATFPLA